MPLEHAIVNLATERLRNNGADISDLWRQTKSKQKPTDVEISLHVLKIKNGKASGQNYNQETF